MSVDGLGAGSADCAYSTGATDNTNKASTSQAISLFLLDKEAKLRSAESVSENLSETPHSTVRPARPEIETIYRLYQVLLSNGRKGDWEAMESREAPSLPVGV